MSDTLPVSWEPISPTQWPARVQLCRQRGRTHGWKHPGMPLSDYEPCEVCGVRVVAIELGPTGPRHMVELTRVSGDPERRSARLKFDARKHHCRGRP